MILDTLAGAKARQTYSAWSGYPVHNVDLFAAQLLNNRLNTRAFHANAGADRIDVRIVGNHRDLCSAARFTRGAFDFNNALVDLRYFLSEQLDQHARMGARQNDLRTPAGNLHTDDIGADPITLAISLSRNLFLLRQYRVGAA